MTIRFARLTRKLSVTLASVVLVAASAAIAGGAATKARWTAAERATLAGLSLASLPPLEPDPSNRVADDSLAAA